MKFGRKIFFTRGQYNGLGTFVRPSRDLSGSFHELFVINFRLVVHMFFGIFSRESDEIWLGNIFQMRRVQLAWDPRGFSGPA